MPSEAYIAIGTLHPYGGKAELSYEQQGVPVQVYSSTAGHAHGKDEAA